MVEVGATAKSRHSNRSTVISNGVHDDNGKPHLTENGDAGEPARAESSKFTCLQACALNTMNMFGTGPLITIPYCLASVSPMGPSCMIGYALAVIACMCDSLVWAEIGSMWPSHGASHTYLRNLYGKNSFGNFMAFMYFWQFILSGPAEIASGCIAVAEYLAYFSPSTVTYGYRVLISLGVLAISVALLYRSVTDTGCTAIILWVIMVGAMLFTIIFGFSGWETDNLKATFPSGASSLIWMVGLSTRFGVFDMTGYYDICRAGDEVQNPRRTIPMSVITTCFTVGIIYILCYVAIISTEDFNDYIHMYTDDYDGVPLGIMSLVVENRLGKAAAYCITIWVCITIMSANYATLCGYSYLPLAAAKTGDFFSLFNHTSKSRPGLADYSLIMLTIFSAIWCFFSLDLVIDAMTTLMVLMQFMGQSIGLLVYRYNKNNRADIAASSTFRMPLFPIPCIIQIILFGFIFITTDSYFLWGSETPTIEMAVLFLALGFCAFLARSYWLRVWPFIDSTTSERMLVQMIQENVVGVKSELVQRNDDSNDLVVSFGEGISKVAIPLPKEQKNKLGNKMLAVDITLNTVIRNAGAGVEGTSGAITHAMHHRHDRAYEDTHVEDMEMARVAVE